MISETINYIEPTKELGDIKKFGKIYGVHKYWSRKPWHPISECILKYSNKGEKVMDPFMGSGVTALESVISGRDFIGFDLNPMSVFISENTIKRIMNMKVFEEELMNISKKVKKLAEDLYSTTDKCDICNKNLILIHSNIGPKFKNSETGLFCCPDCGRSKTLVRRKLNSKDLKKFNKDYKIKSWVPRVPFPKEFYKDRFSYKGITEVSDMFTPRNLYFLSELKESIAKWGLNYKDLFLMAFSNTLLHSSKLKSENVRPLSVNNYWVPDDYIEENPWLRFISMVSRIKEAKQILNERLDRESLGKYQLMNSSSLKTNLKGESIDYIITDPPYGDAIQYYELSYIWNAWLDTNYDPKEELIINPKQKKGKEEFFDLMDKSVGESERLLKKGSYYTLCFHNKDFGIWKGVLDIFKRYNFSLENIEIVQSKGNSYNTNWSKFNPKTDIYLTFKKSKYNATHNKKVFISDIVKEIMNSKRGLPISEIYDYLTVNLISELYYNESTPEISGLTIKKLANIIEEVKNGD